MRRPQGDECTLGETSGQRLSDSSPVASFATAWPLDLVIVHAVGTAQLAARSKKHAISGRAVHCYSIATQATPVCLSVCLRHWKDLRSRTQTEGHASLARPSV